ncbi:hypothetical protein EDD21DRAFT_369271 [Dissophora ornata]|nr:hypothetical protein BGZ58_003722 [Dissophora ornata]KAI8603376.1 hypothetical protein EDD21DRAFT_369271 [Dissophora ornata]
MKLLLQLSVAALLVATTYAGQSIKDFVDDPQIQPIASHLVQQINSLGMESTSSDSQDYPSASGTQVPLLDDIIEIIAQTAIIPKGSKDHDWSRLEAAKIKAIQAHGDEVVKASTDLTAVDRHRALLIVNTIYDTVAHLPTSNRETYAANTAKAKTSSFWDYIGFGLIKSSDAIKNIKSFVNPQGGGCDTSDDAYLKGVEEVVYYSSLTDGLAGGPMAVELSKSPVKALGLGTIIASISKLAVEIHMAQSIARLADLNPSDEYVRAMVYLALAADAQDSNYAQSARDIYNLKSRGMDNKIPNVAFKSLEQDASLLLITKGAGHANGQSSFRSVPVVRNIIAFSSDVLSANDVGGVLKYVFCPGKTDQPMVVESSKSSFPAAAVEKKVEAENLGEGKDEGWEYEDEDEDEDGEEEDAEEDVGEDEDEIQAGERKHGGGQNVFNTPSGAQGEEAQRREL